MLGDFIKPSTHLCGQRLAFALTHLFQLIQRLVNRFDDARGHFSIQPITHGLHRSRQTSQHIDVRLAQEVAYLADRSDISEEIARLKSHLVQFRETLDGGGEVGKRLDFLLQELNREANTVLSKSTDLSIKDAALAIKGEVEKLREQVQNVE